MSFIPFAEGDLELDASTLYEIGERYLAAIQQNVKSGLNARGEALPPGIELYRSGDMLYRDVSVSVGMVRKGQVNVEFNTPYAKFVNNKYHFAGLPPAKHAAFIASLSSIEVRLKGKL